MLSIAQQIEAAFTEPKPKKRHETKLTQSTIWEFLPKSNGRSYREIVKGTGIDEKMVRNDLKQLAKDRRARIIGIRNGVQQWVKI